jgi:pyruvate kinase
VAFAIEHEFDYIAMSFVRNRDNIQELRDILAEYDSPIQIISKVENQEALDHLEEIIEASDGVMVARGDLGVEVPIETLPGHQRKIVNMARKR